MIQAITSYFLGFLDIKKRWIQFLFIFSFFISCSYADSLRPLIVATEIFNPPFIMQGANKQLFGFDIEMMEDICQSIHRECQYRSGFMENTILSSIEKNEADVGVSSITITAERSEHVNFSLPYLPSDAQYLTLKKGSTVPFSKEAFNGKKIGIQVGTMFEKIIKNSGFSDVQIVNFNSTPRLIQALSNEEVDFILQDALSAQYWATEIPVFTPFGKPFSIGYGLGIAVNKNESELLQQINDALLEFQENGQFKKTYDRYILGSYIKNLSDRYVLRDFLKNPSSIKK
ncbi:transporter substrate-binding domain-containing protein [Legionella parisiensis]|uniref:ABC transporter arginine-binding protein 1 n=1 Tax=Legionella parisiensis TaxID=45071 RepID=A0A1E5JTU1_9GAMM|nr:transporter substrate-binding domain-containing protein [Legionella parisiensis]KTD40778.1 putative amino acid ABC transporter, periplasmic binding protein [Legionella parisiensis]OEH47947.1 ABC transporter arginine-binding protein 1 [Legionella parisiensis]STX76773.1 putative amino acid ABC transporter, periplasmic binding protein [Legionella parisiensis]